AKNHQVMSEPAQLGLTEKDHNIIQEQTWRIDELNRENDDLRKHVATMSRTYDQKIRELQEYCPGSNSIAVGLRDTIANQKKEIEELRAKLLRVQLDAPATLQLQNLVDVQARNIKNLQADLEKYRTENDILNRQLSQWR